MDDDGDGQGVASQAIGIGHAPDRSLGRVDTVGAPPLLERLGIGYFRRLSSGSPVSAPGDAIHLLNTDERAELVRVERGAVARACAAGAISALIAAGAEIYADAMFGPGGPAGIGGTARYWLLVGGATGAATVVEILFLYWDALRSVHRLSQVAGLELFPTESGAAAAVSTALARAALELPNPTRTLFPVDPHRESSKLGLAVASLLYKLKVSVSNFLVRVLIRRVVGRALVRMWLPFVAIPVTALWNGIVMRRVLREARIRAMGPSAASELLDRILEAAGPLSDRARVVIVRAVGSAIVRTHDLHPNLAALLGIALERMRPPASEPLDDSHEFLRDIAGLAKAEQRVALLVLAVAAVIDGRLTGDERRLVSEAQRACGRTPDLAPLRRLRRAFVNGHPVDASVVVGLG